MASTISFKKKPTPQADVAAPLEGNVATATAPVVAPATPSTALVAPKATALAAPEAPQTDYKGVGGFEGEFSAKDMATPYLGIFQKSSKGFEDNMEWLGQWVYDKEIPLGTDLKVVFLRAAKSYIEKTEYGSDQIPQRFTRMQDARAAGFNESNLQEAADLDLLIEVDGTAEGVAELAHIHDGDKSYILARYSVRSTAYGRTVGILAKDSAGFLKGNLINGFYVLTAVKKTSDKGTYYTPQLKTAGRTSDELRAQIIERMGQVG
jgi:hypothetical protein